MSEINEQAPKGRRNPLAWIAVIAVGLILFVFLGGDRRDARVAPGKTEVSPVEDSQVIEEVNPSEGTIERSLLLPPGMRAREYIEQIRTAGKPYPLAQVHDKAQNFQHEGSLADAHLLYFFAARENHLPAIIVMAQFSDPVLFQAENSLLDQADAIQAFKWYSKAAAAGNGEAVQRLQALRERVAQDAAAGDEQARRLLLQWP